MHRYTWVIGDPLAQQLRTPRRCGIHFTPTLWDSAFDVAYKEHRLHRVRPVADAVDEFQFSNRASTNVHIQTGFVSYAACTFVGWNPAVSVSDQSHKQWSRSGDLGKAHVQDFALRGIWIVDLTRGDSPTQVHHLHPTSVGTQQFVQRRADRARQYVALAMEIAEC
ncbi:hypothetical protein A5740_02960 [Mycobacterium sp. GA-1841]|nr:hypothetical protein A5740_02960 [Mycobacterium sp. GA-1841]